MGVSLMTTITTSTRQPRSTQAGWLVLGVGSLVALFVGAAAQLAAFVAFGLCMDEDEALCEPGTLPTALEWALTTVPTYLIWLAPSIAAMVIGVRVMRSGNRGGRTLMIVAGTLIVLITAACTAMWWL